MSTNSGKSTMHRRPWLGLRVAVGIAAVLGSAQAQPAPSAPLPPGFKFTGKSDGSECWSTGQVCDAVSQTFSGPGGRMMARLSVRTGDEWNVCEIVDGKAYAYPLSSPSDRVAIPPATMARIARDTNKVDPAIVADPAGEAIDTALVEYRRCNPIKPTLPIS